MNRLGATFSQASHMSGFGAKSPQNEKGEPRLALGATKTEHSCFSGGQIALRGPYPFTFPISDWLLPKDQQCDSTRVTQRLASCAEVRKVVKVWTPPARSHFLICYAAISVALHVNHQVKRYKCQAAATFAITDVFPSLRQQPFWLHLLARAFGKRPIIPRISVLNALTRGLISVRAVEELFNRHTGQCLAENLMVCCALK